MKKTICALTLVLTTGSCSTFTDKKIGHYYPESGAGKVVYDMRLMRLNKDDCLVYVDANYNQMYDPGVDIIDESIGKYVSCDEFD